MFTTEEVFDRTANTYEKTEGKRFDKIDSGTLENVKKHLKSDDIVLDYGCATGSKAIKISPQVKRIYGIDISSRMVELAKRKVAEQNITNTEFIKTTIFDEKFQEGSFDVVLAFNIIHLLENGEIAIERISKLLKPRGLFISITTCLRERRTFLLDMQFLPYRLMNLIKIFPEIKRFRFQELDDLIKGGGFRIIETEKLFQEMSFYYIVAKKL